MSLGGVGANSRHLYAVPWCASRVLEIDLDTGERISWIVLLHQLEKLMIREGFSSVLHRVAAEPGLWYVATDLPLRRQWEAGRWMHDKWRTFTPRYAKPSNQTE